MRFRVMTCSVLVLAGMFFGACSLPSASSPTSGTCGNTHGVNGTGQIIVATGQSTFTGSDGSSLHIYNPNNAYGPAPSCITDWIPGGCTDQGTVFDDIGANEMQGTLPWVPLFTATAEEPQFNGMGVQVLRCGKTWRFLAWDDDSMHSYHEISAPGRTDCPQGEARDTVARVLVHDPSNESVLSADLQERGDNGSGWVASRVDFQGKMIGMDVYPPHCPKEN